MMIQITFFVTAPTKIGPIIPGIVAIVFETPYKIPEQMPPTSLMLIMTPPPCPAPVKPMPITSNATPRQGSVHVTNDIAITKMAGVTRPD